MEPENVWDYPRPPRLERVKQRLRIVLGGETIADTTAGWRVLETSHPPTYYLPRDAFRADALTPSARRSFCEWKGDAVYWNVTGGGGTEHHAGWSYPDPTPDFAPIRDHVAVYAGRMGACFVDDEQVTPQHGGFYGGWITSNLVGPFKGGPDTYSW